MKKQAGFTLIELLLSITILSVILLPVTAVFISALRNNSSLAGVQNMMDSTRYALEYVSRQARLPQRFDGTILPQWGGASPCASMTSGTTYQIINDALVFINSTGDCVSFYLSGNKIETTINSAAPDDLTATSAVSISAVRFVVNGASSSDGTQPIVTIEMDAQGVSNGQPQGAVTPIQTSVSSRTVDVP